MELKCRQWLHTDGTWKGHKECDYHDFIRLWKGQKKMGHTASTPHRAKIPTKKQNGRSHRVNSLALDTDARPFYSARAGKLTEQCHTSKGTRRATKCKGCGETFYPVRSAKTCSAKCRKRLQRSKAGTETKPHRHCSHCGETFAPRNKTHRFCSASCRTMSYRTRRAELVAVYSDVMELPIDRTMDVIETAGTAALRAVLETVGYGYDDRRRAWTLTA